MGIPSLTLAEDRRQLISSLNIKDGELQQAFLKQHEGRRPVSHEEKPCQEEHQEDVPHDEGCQDSCEDAEVKEVHHLGEFEEEGHGGGDQEEPRYKHQEEPLESEGRQEEVDHHL